MVTLTLTAPAVLLLTLVVLATVGLVAIAAKWLDFGIFGHFMFFAACQSILDAAGSVLGAILSAAAGNE